MRAEGERVVGRVVGRDHGQRGRSRAVDGRRAAEEDDEEDEEEEEEEEAAAAAASDAAIDASRKAAASAPSGSDASRLDAQ